MITIKITKECEDSSIVMKGKPMEWIVTDTIENLNGWLDTLRKNQKTESVTYGNFVIKYVISHVTKKNIIELEDKELLFNAIIIYPDRYFLYEYIFHKPNLCNIKEISEDMKKMKFDKFVI